MTATSSTTPPPPSAAATPLTEVRLRRYEDDVEWELVHGKPERKDLSARSAWIGNKLGTRLTVHCERTTVGSVYGSDCGYRIVPDSPNHHRKPDVSFVTADQWPPDQPPPDLFDLAPYLAVEVISPTDNANRLNVKVREYFDAGVAAVWLIDPSARTLQVLRPDGNDTRHLHDDAQVVGEGPLDGFAFRLGDILPRVPAPDAEA